MPRPFQFKRIAFFVMAMCVMGLVTQVVAIPDSLNPRKLFSHKAPTPTASLSFSKEGKRLYVYIYIQQATDVSNSVKVVWSCPPTAICGNSEYSLHYSGLHYQTRAYRTVVLDTQDGDPVTCVGDWKVSIINADNKEIASGIFTVKDDSVLEVAENTPVAADDTDTTDEDINQEDLTPHALA